MEDKEITSVSQLQEDKLYRLYVLQHILKALGLNYSIFTIRDYETWKCLDYKCGKRHSEKVEKCERCGGPVREPLLESPRTMVRGKGFGHRRYKAEEIRKIVQVFQERV